MLPLLTDRSGSDAERYMAEIEQDDDNAQLNPCVVPYVSVFLAALTVVITLGRICKPYVQRWRFRPAWTRPFVQEYPETDLELVPSRKRSISTLYVVLLFFSVLGLASKIVPLTKHYFDLPATLLAGSWVSKVNLD